MEFIETIQCGTTLINQKYKKLIGIFGRIRYFIKSYHLFRPNLLYYSHLKGCLKSINVPN